MQSLLKKDPHSKRHNDDPKITFGILSCLGINEYQ